MLSRTEDLADEMFPMTLGEPCPEETPADVPSYLAATIHADKNGYVQFYELEEAFIPVFIPSPYVAIYGKCTASRLKCDKWRKWQ